MKLSIRNTRSWLFVAAFMTCSPWAQAICYKVTGVGSNTSTIPQSVVNAGYTASDWGGGLDAYASAISFGVLNLGSGSETLDPAGTVLAIANLNFLSDAQKKSYSANQVLFKCAREDADKIFEMYALNASSGALYGGKETNDVPGVYLTPAKNIGYRITNLNTGQLYANRWKERRLTAADYVTIGNQIYILASAFSNATFELVKTNDTSASVSDARNAFDSIVQPQAFVAFKAATAVGPISQNIVTGAIVSSLETPNWPGVWSMRGGGTKVIRGATCAVADFDQIVKFPPVSAGELRRGGNSSNTFNISIDCDAGATSGTTSNTTKPSVAMGLLVMQPTALSAAAKLNLITSAGGISYLLDNNYGMNGVASGVGIRIFSPRGMPLNLLSSNKITGTGNDAGWYGFAELLSPYGDTPNGGKQYQGIFRASLEQLPGLTAEKGSVNAQVQIIVSLQ